MTVPLSEQQVEDALDEMLDLIPRLRHRHAELRSADSLSKRSRNRSGFGGGGKGGHSDPTYQAAERGLIGKSEVHTTLARMVANIHSGRQGLLAALNVSKASRPPEPEVSDEDWCTSCARAKVFNPRGPRAGLCRWCYDYQLAEGALPLPGVIRRRQKGERITTKVIAEENLKWAKEQAA